MRSTGSDEAIECPPSAPIRHATLPDAITASAAAAVPANSSASGYRAISWRTRSICSRVAVTAASPASSAGTYTDQNWPPTPPARSRGRSVCVKSVRPAISIAHGGPGERASRSAHGRSLCPSTTGNWLSSSRADRRPSGAAGLTVPG